MLLLRGSFLLFGARLLCSGANADHADADHVLMGEMSQRKSFVQLQRSPAEMEHEVVFQLKNDYVNFLEEELLARSTPSNTMFQKWMSDDELHKILYNPSRINLIRDFLASEGVTQLRETRHGEFLRATASISIWERIFRTEFYDWRDEARANTLVRRGITYSLPRALHPHVTSVFYTVAPPFVNHIKVKLDPERAPSSMQKQLNSILQRMGLSSTQEATIEFLNQKYQIPSNQGSALYNQSVFESLNQEYRLDDLHLYQRKYGNGGRGAPEEIPYNRGGGPVSECQNQKSCAEGSLDVQLLNGLCNTMGLIWWEVPDTNKLFEEFILQVSDCFCYFFFPSLYMNLSSLNFTSFHSTFSNA
jgi:hypothetical protein